MFDICEDVTEKYDLSIQETAKGRGITILYTDKGTMAFKEYKGSGRHLVWSSGFLEKIYREGKIIVDSCVRNKEGEFITEAGDGSRYIVKHWHEARDCDVKRTEDLYMAVRGLAILHNQLESYSEEDMLYEAKSLLDEYKSHNQELRRIKKYLYGKNNRTEFESLATNCCDIFMEEGKIALERLLEFKPEEKLKRGLCHGSYNFHNICFQGNVPVIINFEKQNYNYRMVDLYYFMRKIMEKTDWDISLGKHMINEYSSQRQISNDDLFLLTILFSYPEKFWKLINGYFNSNKAWVPRKKYEKLEKLVEQNKKRQEFIKSIHS